MEHQAAHLNFPSGKHQLALGPVPWVTRQHWACLRFWARAADEGTALRDGAITFQHAFGHQSLPSQFKLYAARVGALCWWCAALRWQCGASF